MLQLDDPPVIPLWINGRAFLTMAPAFQDVYDRKSGRVVRRTPLCGPREALLAVNAAQDAHAAWSAQTSVTRCGLHLALSESLAGYASHFAELIAVESGKKESAASDEVAAAIAVLRDDATGRRGRETDVIGVIGDALQPLIGPLQFAIPYLKDGATVVFRPSPETPSVLFALAELSGRCGFPAGVINVLHGGRAAVDGLRAAPGCELIFSGG